MRYLTISVWGAASGATDLNVWSECITFKAPGYFSRREAEEGNAETFTFAVFGDMGTAEEDGSLDIGGEEVGRKG